MTVASAAVGSVHARQIFDSRGRPTIEVDVTTTSGVVGRASVPSGASTGTHEAWELRDGGDAYAGLGVSNAVANVNGEIASALRGFDVLDQRGVDTVLVALDGTQNLRRLGANAVLGVSLAVSRAAAQSNDVPLYQWLGELGGGTNPSLPMPMVNILSGGLHAGRGMDVQDFLAVPASATTIDEALTMVGLIRSAAAQVMAERGLTTLLADEGGLSPGLDSSEAALELMVASFERAGLSPGVDAVIAIDVAAHSLWDQQRGEYNLAREGRRLGTPEMIEMVCSWVDDFPVVSIEDALDEEDWEGWKSLTARLGDRINLIGDDFFTTNPIRLQRGVDELAANGVLVKVNQNGTLTGTLDVVAAARAAQYVPVVSARSGETEDSFISDLAVATGAGQIKVGSVRCSDRLSKYNQLVRIAENGSLPFARMDAYPRFASVRASA
ncbi:phosphopyruvate hydratase [Rhodococcus opacus]|uniref:phosphopyruvate hydratase n=1 Tax=Rhodococcus opacus TaxID=37919 RepID=UPI00155A90E2|nr:phosphopyruvate hydratase [Rhodococcus opacus]